MTSTVRYELVRLKNGICSMRSLAEDEIFHPAVGPMAEAEALYVNQSRLRERLQNSSGEFVIWDVGLGAAANAIAALRATREISGQLRIISFDNTGEPLEFALKNVTALGYLAGYENQIAGLLRDQRVKFENGKLKANWEFHLGDFPALLARSSRGNEAHSSKSEIRNWELEFPAPHAIFHDAFSPMKNPEMWTLPLFTNLIQLLDPTRSCALMTFSRSTLVRATLLLAGFFVGTGHAAGLKEETTIAANTLELIVEPLNARWLTRALRSDSAEPLLEPVYSRAPLSPATAEKLCQHPQFN